MKTKKLIYLVGISGSGKTRYKKKNFPDHVVVSPDEIRKELTGNISDQSRNKEVFALAFQRLRENLDKYNMAVLDAVNTNSKLRADGLKQFDSPDIEKIAIVFPSNVELSRSRVRKDIENGVDRSNVPDYVFDRQASDYNSGLADLNSQFDKVISSDIKFESYTKLYNYIKTLINEINENAPQKQPEVLPGTITKPETPTRRRTLTPPKEAPKTKPKAALKKLINAIDSRYAKLKDNMSESLNESSVLKEIEFKDLFSVRSMNTLKSKSKEAYEKIKDVLKDMDDLFELHNEIMKIENSYRDMLEEIAVEEIYKLYPILKIQNIKFDVKLGESSITSDSESDEYEDTDDITEEDVRKADIKKRRILNAITQGAANRGSFGFNMFSDVIESIDDGLYEKYNDILKNMYGYYDNEHFIAMMMTILSTMSKSNGGGGVSGAQKGESDIKWDPENDTFVIIARATILPILMQEMIKGIYEILSLQSFSYQYKQYNQAIVNAADKHEYEIEDFAYGKYLYDTINELFINSEFDDLRVRDFLFVEIYKLPDNEFFSFIENSINNELSSNQRKWVNDTMKDIDDDLKLDDSESSINNQEYEDDKI